MFTRNYHGLNLFLAPLSILVIGGSLTEYELSIWQESDGLDL